MEKFVLKRNGFKIRALRCKECGKRIYHPLDEARYKQFNDIKNKLFKVKLRTVGNSWAISIPKEIIDFIHEQERHFDAHFNAMVRLCMEEMGKLSLIFDEKTRKKENGTRN